MSTWTFSCWSCRQTTEFEDKLTRSDVCPHCQIDCRSCKNCQFHDPGAHNQCTETIAEYVPDKERSNFCGMFRAFSGQREAGADIDAAKAKLAALFKK